MADDGKDSSRSAWLMIQVGVYLFVVGAIAVGLWWLRSDTIPDYQLRAERAELLARGELARGSQPTQTYREGEWLRMRGFAPAKTGDGGWVGVEEDSVLVVRGEPVSDNGKGWLFATELGQPSARPLMVHTSFVERYDPLVLEGGLELSNCRLRRYEKTGGVYYSVSGELRNGADQTLSQCEVVCHLHDPAGEPLVELRSAPLALEAGKFGEFETTLTGEDGPVTAFSLRAQYEKAGQKQESSQVQVSLRIPREASRGQSTP
jgi:hypothetical protein